MLNVTFEYIDEFDLETHTTFAVARIGSEELTWIQPAHSGARQLRTNVPWVNCEVLRHIGLQLYYIGLQPPALVVIASAT